MLFNLKGKLNSAHHHVSRASVLSILCTAVTLAGCAGGYSTSKSCPAPGGFVPVGQLATPSETIRLASCKVSTTGKFVGTGPAANSGPNVQSYAVAYPTFRIVSPESALSAQPLVVAQFKGDHSVIYTLKPGDIVTLVGGITGTIGNPENTIFEAESVTKGK